MQSRIWFPVMLALVVIVGITAGMAIAYQDGMYISTRGPLELPQEQPLSPRASETVPNVSIGATVLMTPFSYQPETVVVQQGEAIRFTNAGIARQRPMSDPHPMHGNSSLDADGFVAPGRSWYAVMTATGTFSIHDEVYPNVAATVIVQ